MAHYALAGLVGWLAALSIGVVGYLLSLRITQLRRNRQTGEKRQLLPVSRL